MVTIIICISICVTLTVWFCIAAKVFYDLRINKEFATKVKDTKSVIDGFRSIYIQDYHSDKAKFIGKGTDLRLLIKQLNNILNLDLWNL